MSAKGSLNKVMLIARLGHDPELKHTTNGTAVTTLRVATNEIWKDGKGKSQSVTEWHRVVLWKQLAEIAGEHLTKGSRIYVEGSLRTRVWEDAKGDKKYTTEIIGQTMTMLDSKSAGPPSDPVSEPPEADEPLPEEEALPV
ncbi:single-stranded DNA-binding protein [bacterium]|nr:single-stranded DNA-binding protein [bacterium]